MVLERTPLERQILAKVMFDAGKTFKVIARALPGISMATLMAIKRNSSYDPVLLDSFKRRLPFKAYKLADDVLDLIDLSEVKKAPLNIKMMTFGIAIDKARDLEGSNRPVFNVVQVVNDCRKTRERLEWQLELIAKARRQHLDSTSTPTATSGATSPSTSSSTALLVIDQAKTVTEQ